MRTRLLRLGRVALVLPLALACAEEGTPNTVDTTSYAGAANTGTGTDTTAQTNMGGGSTTATGTSAADTSAAGGATVMTSGAGAPSMGDATTAMAGTSGVASGGAASTGAGGAMAMGGAGDTASGGAQMGSAGAADSMGAGGATAAGGEFTINAELASDVESSAPGTVGIVTWSTTIASFDEAYIEFGLTTDYGMRAPVDLDEPEYRTLLLGMKPASEYHYRVLVYDGSTTLASDDQTIQTGPPTNAVSIGDFTVLDEAGREPGFIVMSYWQGNGGSVAFVIDADGDIVWWFEAEAPGIARARMSEDGKSMWIISASNQGSPLQRVSLDTFEGQTYMATTGSHDLTPVSGAVMAYLDYGESDCDSIFEIDPSGEAVEVFESDPFVGGGGCHSNALRYSKAEDVYTFSDVSQDILVIDRESGELAWRLTEIVDGGVQTWGGRQHGHHLLSDSMVVFANGGGQGEASAAIEYTLDGEEIFFYESGDGSANLGDVQRLPGGNTLVTFSNDSIVHEVSPDGEVVMQFDGGGSRIGYTLWRPSLYGPPPDIGD